MSKKRKNTNNLLARFGIGLCSGLLGGAIAFGGLYAINSGSNQTSTGVQTAQSSTKVSNVKYNVNSDITEAVQKVQGAVVSIINLQSQSSNSNGLEGLFGGSSQNDNSSQSSDSLETASEGSGVIYKKEGNYAYVVTNNHVVEGQSALQVLLADGQKVDAELVGTDSYTDLAVVKISSKYVTTVATFGDSSQLKVGEPAIAIGSPLGTEYANSVTEGIISSLNRQVVSQNDSGQEVNINAIQTDAAINPGNSGGALVNIAGQVIGINSSKIASTSTSSSGVSVEGMGFAIPSNDVTTIISQLEKNGKVTRPALGVRTVDLNALTDQQKEQILKVPTSLTNGVVLAQVNSATPAEKAGLKQYDVITAIDGQEVKTGTELRAALYKKSVGDSIKVTYYRGNDKKTTTVALTVDQSINEKN
ncbi:S1C family serine protease [Enterococcus columbae]|uniref:Serine protease do-like htrA n=1 Tax=Enterococcus columbae DSM 7374 = ATCC 51263 TaxID=1121865 RepID=S1N4T4_9ENTE|nr:trypsin-like peptidase domain-containing protein [Enterococcus columbae]EOT39627.1 serine protease do-like htrA [Enterococcus columbae DSM 7374 = ATCC 51263]EOW84020.1 serine protease do-like htrA [Enterococcus columbae DSM 7374 = ATCC 51263]OJG25760.1 serine protease do-like htrA [Enterococcus columbae DSM 7374 = ATCC 51263]